MTRPFDYFVIYAEMRTGSNFLEENVNEYPGLQCYGEAFNPVFMGGANKTEMLGVTLQEREADPERLLQRMQAETEGLPGFRFFHDHDPRILDKTLADPRCGKIILTRNPIDSYVSRKIAAETGQWRLNDMKNAKSAQITFDRAEFETHLDKLQGFQRRLMQGLQTSGQAAFYIGYDDIRDLDVLDGLAAYLGVDHKKERTTQRTKVQNPSALEHKVANFEEMRAEIAQIDRFDLTRTPNFEPRRAPAIPSYVAAAEAPLLYQPIKAGPTAAIEAWLTQVDGVTADALRRGFTQKTLRQWKRQHPGHRSFAVVRHPVVRLHAAFVAHILGHGDETFGEIRENLRKNYTLPLPEGAPGDDFSADQHRAAFLAFATFVKGNLGGQTGIRVDAAWASQTEVLAGFAQFQVPDMVLREPDLKTGLAQLAAQAGVAAPDFAPAPDKGPVTLADIYDREIEDAVRSAYQKDYMMFGFKALRL
ncbi:Glutamate synthase [NADPH] large chain [Candidatus Rhodobacter oscarellae]|uniref:Glutamate synthase [NADPH] large chain n=1 Tax=Candidatus Rhodobacter oscarellae TaxID=1675527 RepID=A0A0J9EAU1_9RHOB|nr:sulfotransferase family 2 domain-containing protein [Candidatus Rhodobacter lobularis]KMW58784.1 Glutamate synthase [NADPH] large chain [Candidatus Rhodobacter lobularis]